MSGSFLGENSKEIFIRLTPSGLDWIGKKKSENKYSNQEGFEPATSTAIRAATDFFSSHSYADLADNIAHWELQ